MRLLSYSTDMGPSFGLLSADGRGVIDLAARFRQFADLGELILAGAIEEAARFVEEPAEHRLDDVVFERLLPRPGKIFCIGVNYQGRSAEYADTNDACYPSVFVRFPESFTGHDRPLIRPPESHQLDYEGEIVVVIGQAGRRIPIAAARDHIAGVSLANEGTIRDWVRHAKFNVTQGKNWESTGSIGPWLVPIDEVGAFEDLHLTTTVNGEVRQDDTPATMKYPIEYQIHYLSTFVTLQPGDMVLTGTPTGAGARHDPPVWLEPGDTVEVSVADIGTLRNTVADEFDDPQRYRAPDPR